MSFSGDFYSKFIDKRKKKEEEEKQNSTVSFSDAFYSAMEGEDRVRTTEDIKPLYVNKTAPLYTSSTEGGFGSGRATGRAGSFGGHRSFDPEKANDRTWFQAGALDDGNLWLDIPKAILGTAGDLVHDVGAGVLGIPEAVVDAGASMVGTVGGWLGFDEFEEDVDSWITHDLIDEESASHTLLGGWLVDGVLGAVDTNMEDASVLGEKTDSLAQSGGQLLGTVGLQALGVPWWVTTGVTSYGASYEEAIMNGATHDEALMVGVINAGSEILTEKLFGGSGLGELGLVNLDGLTSNISSKLVKRALDFGIDMTAEGVEEVASQLFSNFATTIYSEENWKDILFSEEALDGYIESFVGGMALSGVMNAGKVSESTKTGRDYRTGMNAREKAVFDRVYQQMLAEESQHGKIDPKRKAEIYDEVMLMMEKGYISTDTIEEVLGGEAYQTYRDTIAKEDATIKEFEELYEGDELRQQIADFMEHSEREQLKNSLTNDMLGIVKGTHLAESYIERGRRGQKFTADLSQYDTKHHATIQRAIDSGILNNTNRTHEFVEMLAKIEADHGITFDFTNNERLKNSGFAIEGKVVNGYITDGGVVLNINSAKALNAVVGHEITHAFEGTELYGKLQEVVFEYAKSKTATDSKFKNEYLERLHNAQQLYGNVEGYKGLNGSEKIKREIVADMVGDYLFTDRNFVSHLATTNRNMFRRAWDRIKYLYDVATAGSKEAKELAKVKKIFEDVYRQKVVAKSIRSTPVQQISSTQETPVAQETAIEQETVSGNNGEYGVIERLLGMKRVSNTFANDIINNEAIAQAFTDLTGVELEGTTEHKRWIIRETVKEWQRLSEENDAIAMAAAEQAEAEYAQEQAEAEKARAEQAIRDSGYRSYIRGLFFRGATFAEAQEVARNPEMRAEWESVTGKTLPQNEKSAIKMIRQTKRNPDNISLPQYSLSDSDGKQLTAEQQEYFKDSKMRDDNGNLMVMYHGSTTAGDNIFDSRFSDDGISLFFVDRNDVAASYSGTMETYAPSAWKTAEDANNFFEKIGKDEYFVDEKNGKYRLRLDGGAYYFDIAESEAIDDLYDEFCDYEGVGHGAANYKVYLNLTNPLIVDADGRNWNRVTREFSQEVYDRYQTLTAEEKDALTDLAEWEDFSIFKDEVYAIRENIGNGEADALTSAVEKLMDEHGNIDVYDLFSIASEGFENAVIQNNAAKYLTTRDYAQRAKEQGYDGVIFKNIVDNGGYSNGSEGASTVAIAFDSNQIKSVANKTPTGDPDIRYSLSSIANTFFGDENMSANDFAKMDYRDTQGYHDYVEQCVNNFRQSRPDANLVVARQEIEEAIDGIVRVAIAAKQAGYDIHDDAAKRDVRDSKKRLLFSSLEPNSDYITSNDISTICDKRKNFAEIYDEIVRMEEAKGVPENKRFFKNVDNYFVLHKLMADKGLTQPCQQCYVESMRKNLAPMADAFLRLVRETNPDNIKNDQLYHQSGKNKGEQKVNNASIREMVLVALAEYDMGVNDLTVETLTTADGLAALKIQAPMVYEAFNSFYGQSKPKMPKAATPFRFGELTALLTDEHGKIKQSVVDKINHTGGFRLQSYSDFQIQNFTDTLQVLFEAGTLGLKGHAYTKVPAFLDATNGTNLKRNISIFMYKDGGEWKLDRNDSFPYTLDEIYDIVKADKTGNTGIIAVSQNEDMSAWIMANDYVGYGIPFHKSGLKMGTVRDTIVREGGREIKGYTGIKDHTKQQTEVWANSADGHKALTKVKKGIDIYSFWDFDNTENRSKNDLIKKNVMAYIDACEDAGYLPKFRAYVMNNGEVLHNVLKYSKSLGFVPQDATIDDISFKYKGYTIPYGYYKFLGDFGMFKPDGTASPHEVLSLKNYNFDEAVKFFEDAETLRRNEILQQFSNGEERERYRNSNLTTGQLADIVGRKRREIAEGVVGSRSLSEDYAPIRRDHSGIYGEDIALAEAPVQEVVDADNATMFPDDVAPVTTSDDEHEERLASITDADAPPVTDEQSQPEKKGKASPRQELHSRIMDGIREEFRRRGYDFDEVLKNAKNLSTFATVDNIPQRVLEKALGYKEGQVLSDLTINKVAQNETEGIKWLNSYTDRKSGLLRLLSDQYHIKPGSKESAAAQMYAEGFYVDDNNNIIEYGDAELAKDFPNRQTQANIKGLASDPRIRTIYDDTLAMINESRTRNAYPEIPRLDNYFLHFRAMDDTFSRLGLPFNPNDIRAKDLPTDLNGVTADLKPGQPFFASAMHRTGKRTSFDLLGGLERYLTSAKNQIYHIDDIQTLRALRNHIADTYGQAHGLEGLDVLSEEEVQDRIEKVYGSHLSTFAKFLNEEANILAGKTALIDRGLEGIIGRRGIQFLNNLNQQVGSNQVGYSVSSPLTNFLPVTQAFAKTNKAAFVKAFAQTTANKVNSIFGRSDGFAEQSPVMIRRKGADRFHRTFWQKLGDPGYALMGAVDNISTELIARTKYNELTSKGMDSQTAHYETDKWVSRLMGDRSLGQMPQLYNSKMLGLITKYQLEVRNQLDSQFYDTIQEAKVSNEHIENALARNAKTAAKVTSTLVQLAVVQHLFGTAFESVAGYNPAFDIIDVVIKMFGWDDEEDSEDTALDNIEEGFLALLEDLPYTSVITNGGRIPISSALPIGQFITGEDEYGNEKSRWETIAETAPYYLMPGGYGQLRKTVQGLSMFSDDHPVAGSYTDSGNLRFPVEDTFANRVQAGLFGQWANENARDYIDNERKPLNEKQVQEYIDVDIPIRDYWEYREGLQGMTKLSEKADYIASLDLPIDKKNILVNNIANREEPIDLTGYENFAGFDEFDFAMNNPEKYEIAQQVGGYEAYMGYQEGMKGMKLAEKVDYIAGLNLTTAQKNALINGETDRKEPIDLTGYDPSLFSSFEEFEYSKSNPDKYAVAKSVGGYEAYRSYMSDLYDIKADKDENGKSVSGSRKEKVLEYINNMDADYYTKIILWRSEYPSDDTYNMEIINYLNGRSDISFEEEVAILRELGFDVSSDGTITW